MGCPCSCAHQLCWHTAARNASVFVSADARVWTLNALVFKRTVIAAMRKRVMERVSWLSGVKILKALSKTKRAILICIFPSKVFSVPILTPSCFLISRLK